MTNFAPEAISCCKCDPDWIPSIPIIFAISYATLSTDFIFGRFHGSGFFSHPRRGRATVGTDIPGQFHQPCAVLAGLLQLGMAVRADLPVVAHTALAAGAQRLVFD